MGHTTDYPTDIQIDTPIGPVWLTVTSGEHIHVDACRRASCHGTDHNLVMNRVEYQSASWHVQRVAGQWREIDYRSLYMTRADWANGPKLKETSLAAREKFRLAVLPAVEKWAAANGHVLIDGERVKAQKEIAQLERDIAKRENEIVEARALIAELQATLDA